MDKSPWDSNAIFLFFCHSGVFFIKQCILFEIFLQFSPPPPTLYHAEIWDKFTSNIVCGVRGGVGPGKSPEMRKGPKTSVHDCTSSFSRHLALKWSAGFCRSAPVVQKCYSLHKSLSTWIEQFVFLVLIH